MLWKSFSEKVTPELRFGREQTRKRMREGYSRQKKEQEQRHEKNWAWFVRETVSAMVEGIENIKPIKTNMFLNTQDSYALKMLVVQKPCTVVIDSHDPRMSARQQT